MTSPRSVAALRTLITQALAMVHTLAANFAQEVARLCQVEVTPSPWETFLDARIPGYTPLPLCR